MTKKKCGRQGRGIAILVSLVTNGNRGNFMTAPTCKTSAIVHRRCCALISPNFILFRKNHTMTSPQKNSKDLKTMITDTKQVSHVVLLNNLARHHCQHHHEYLAWLFKPPSGQITLCKRWL